MSLYLVISATLRITVPRTLSSLSLLFPHYLLHHPNIVEYYGIEVHRDKVYIFEEYCQGGSLAQLLEHGRIEDEGIIQVYTLQMLEGLAYLHSEGIVHRDVKPDSEWSIGVNIHQSIGNLL